MNPRTMLDKFWATHEVTHKNGTSLLWVDRHLVHDGSHHAFAKIADRGLAVAEPDLTTGVADHYVPIRGTARNPDLARMIDQLMQNTARHGIRCYGMDDPRQGIVHMIGPELGLKSRDC